MASAIDITQPPEGEATTAGVRANFEAAALEITALQEAYQMIEDALAAIDTPISTRAPADTALSTEIWTNALAAALTNIAAGDYLSRALPAGALTATPWAALVPTHPAGVTNNTNWAQNWTTVLDYAGSGRLEYLCFRAAAVGCGIELAIDNVKVADIPAAAFSGALLLAGSSITTGGGSYLQGIDNGDIPIRSRLTVRTKGAGGIWIMTASKIRQTL